MCTQCEKYCIHMQRKGVHFIIDGTKRLFSVIFLCQSLTWGFDPAQGVLRWEGWSSGRLGAARRAPSRTSRENSTPGMSQRSLRYGNRMEINWFISNKKTVKHSKIWKYIFFLLKYVQISRRTCKKNWLFYIFCFVYKLKLNTFFTTSLYIMFCMLLNHVMRLRNAEILLLNIVW